MDRSNIFSSLHFELERSADIVKFMEAFYNRYAILYYSDNEKEKAANLKIKVKLESERYLHITRDELDDIVSNYRKIYKQFMSIRLYVNKDEVALFDRYFTVDNYCYLFRLEKVNSPLQNWVEGKSDASIVAYIGNTVLNADVIDIVRKKLFNNDADHATVLKLMVNKHLQFFDFMLRLRSFLSSSGNSNYSFSQILQKDQN